MGSRPLTQALAFIGTFVLPTPQPFYADGQFWATIAAVVAIVLSQLPPVRLWFRPRRLEVEVHSRVQITHKVGNPNLGMYVSVRNTGGRELRIRSLQISLSRDGKSLGSLPAQNYFETASSQSTVLFVPFSLKPGETWAHGTNFLNLFDRATEKLYRESVSVLGADIQRKLDARPENDKQAVIAEPNLVEPFMTLFNRLFAWLPGEYVVELSVVAEPGSASFSRKYRFTSLTPMNFDRTPTTTSSAAGFRSASIDTSVFLFRFLSMTASPFFKRIYRKQGSGCTFPKLHLVPGFVGSLKLVCPSGRKARNDSTIGALLRDWDRVTG